MATFPEARAAHAERIRRQGRERVRRELMRVGPPCPRCGGRTQARLVELTGDPVHPGCYTVEEEPPPRSIEDVAPL